MKKKKITSIADEGRKTGHKVHKIRERNREAGLNMVSSKEKFSFFMEAHYLLSKAKTPSHAMASLSLSLSPSPCFILVTNISFGSELCFPCLYHACHCFTLLSLYHECHRVVWVLYHCVWNRMDHVAKLFAPWCTTWGLQCFFFSKTHNYKN